MSSNEKYPHLLSGHINMHRNKIIYVWTYQQQKCTYVCTYVCWYKYSTADCALY